MILDDGVLTVCVLKNVAPKGAMPREILLPVSSHYYGERTVGFARQYAAKGVSEQVDKLVRIWQNRQIRIGMYILEVDTGEQYRVDNVQHLDDEDGLRVTHLTLKRLDDLYDVDK